jgi:lysozyme
MKIAELIKRHEGTGPYRAGRFFPYSDGLGKITIGWGHNLSDRGLPEGIVEALLAADLETAIADARAIFGDAYAEAAPARQAALVDMAFNLGRRRLSRFKKMIAAVLADDWTRAANEALDSNWAHQVGARAAEDAVLLRDGDFPATLT